MKACLKTVKLDAETHAQLCNATSILEGRRCEKDPGASMGNRLTQGRVAEMAIKEGLKHLLAKRVE